MNIFDYLKPNNNDILSKLTNPDLLNLLVLIDDYYLELRSNLNLNSEVSIGLELEFENTDKLEIARKIYQNFPKRDWIVKNDISLHEGAEINSPILIDQSNSWNELAKICSIVYHYASIGENSAGHIHIGAHIFKDNKKYWLNFIKLWAVYENVIFRFLYGEYLTHRPKIANYAEPISNLLWEDYLELSKSKNDMIDILYKINHDRRKAINFENLDIYDYYKFGMDNTIEFRCPNGSLNPIIWQNNVNFITKLLLYSKSSSFNDEIINKRKSINKNYYYSLEYYDEIYLEQAMELTDLIFKNNIDKISFLRQYLIIMNIQKLKQLQSKNHFNFEVILSYLKSFEFTTT